MHLILQFGIFKLWGEKKQGRITTLRCLSSQHGKLVAEGNICLFTHSAVTQQHYYSLGAMFSLHLMNLNPIFPLILALLLVSINS